MLWLLVATWEMSNKSKTEATWLCQGLDKGRETSPEPRVTQWERLQIKRSI